MDLKVGTHVLSEDEYNRIMNNTDLDEDEFLHGVGNAVSAEFKEDLMLFGVDLKAKGLNFVDVPTFYKQLEVYKSKHSEAYQRKARLKKLGDATIDTEVKCARCGDKITY